MTTKEEPETKTMENAAPNEVPAVPQGTATPNSPTSSGITMKSYIDTPYLTPANLGHQGEHTIKFIQMQMVGADKDKEEKPVCYFKDEVKPHVVNKTNAKFLVTHFGENLTDYVDKKISIVVLEELAFGKIQSTIRYQPIAI